MSAVAKPSVSLSDLVSLLRPLDWWYFLPAPALGARLLGLPWLQVWGALAAACCLAYAYGANGLVDRMHDSGRKNPYAGRASVPLVARLVVLGVALPVPLLVALGLTSAWPLASLAAGTLYSVPPLRLKRVAFLGDLGNMLIFLPLLLAAPGVVLTPGAACWIGWIALQLQMSQMIHCLQDLDEDRRRGLHNTVICLGQAGSKLGLLVLGLAATALPLLGTAGALRLVLVAGSLLALLVVALAQRGLAPMQRLRLVHRLLGMVTLAGAFLAAG